MTPDLSQLSADLATLASNLSALASKLAATGPTDAAEPDRLLRVEEACALLGGISKDHAYNSTDLKPVRVRVGRRVMFSSQAIQRLIARRAGR